MIQGHDPGISQYLIKLVLLIDKKLLNNNAFYEFLINSTESLIRNCVCFLSIFNGLRQYKHLRLHDIGYCDCSGKKR